MRIVAGYRVNLGFWRSVHSVVDPFHNDFWFIWSDLVPFGVFLAFAWAQTSSLRFMEAPAIPRMLESMVYTGIIICRGLSAVYHIFNSASLWANRHLVYVDQIGISSMAWVSPFFFAMSERRNIEAAVATASFGRYTEVLGVLTTMTYALFLGALMFGEHPVLFKLREPLLVALAGVGNWPSLRIAMDPLQPRPLRLQCGVSLGCLVGAYVVCYKLAAPERFLRPGLSDGKIWNSHVLWHLFVAVGQCGYMLVPFLYGDTHARSGYP